MKAYIKRIITLSTLLAVSQFAHGSLIYNGGFEEISFSDNKQAYGLVKNTKLSDFANKQKGWDVFREIPGWFTSSGNGIEVQKNIVTKSHGGSYHVELDSHQRGRSNSMMTQTVDSLKVGGQYLLEFYYKPRTNGANDNGIEVYWMESVDDMHCAVESVMTANSTRGQMPHWQLMSVVFEATASSMDLSFAAAGRQNTLGGLIDNVSLVEVPEPATMALLLFPAGLMMFGRKRNKSI